MRIQRILACVLVLTLMAVIPAALADESAASLQQYDAVVTGGWYYSPIDGWVWLEGPPSDQIIYYPGVGYILNDNSRPLSWPFEGAGLPKDQPSSSSTTTYTPSVSHGRSNSGTLTSTSATKVYAGPSTKNEVLGSIQAGESLDIISWDTSGGWVRVYYNNRNNAGWVQAKHVK